MFVDTKSNKVNEDEITILFEYEDALKETILKTGSGKESLKKLKAEYKKIYIVPTAK